MKRCPECRRDYYDGQMIFCLDDGTRLLDGPAVSHTDITVSMPQMAVGAASETENTTLILSDHPLGNTSPTVDQPAKRSIAVMPFVNLSADPENEYFCDGLAEDLINALAKIGDIRVVARTSAFSFKGTNADARSIGNQLNVSTILEGSVRKAGERLRINVQLINAADGFHLWTERYDRKLLDIFDVQDEVTAAVIDSLRVKLLGAAPLQLRRKRYTGNVEAYEVYLHGRYFLNMFTAESFEKAIEFFEHALAIDPKYALAHAGIADGYVMLSELGPLDAADAMPKAREHALKALSLDNDLAEAHCSLGIIQRDYDYDFERAERAFKMAIGIEPGDPTARLSYGLLLSYIGRHAEAEGQFRVALDVDPLSVIGNWFYSLGLFQSRSYDACIDQSKRTLELDDDFPGAYLTLGFANHMKGNYADAIEGYARFSGRIGGPHIAVFIRESFSARGWTGFLQAMTGEERPVELSSYIIAVFHAALGEKDKAVFELEKAFENRESYLAMLKVDPRLDVLRGEPSFVNLMGRIGFPG